MVLARLKEIDIVAYIRFASVYRDYQDIESFTEEIKRVHRKPRKRIRGEAEV